MYFTNITSLVWFTEEIGMKYVISYVDMDHNSLCSIGLCTLFKIKYSNIAVTINDVQGCIINNTSSPHQRFCSKVMRKVIQ